MRMFELLMEFQSTIFEMNITGLLTAQEFGILETITENMTTDKNALELAIKLTIEDLVDPDIVDSIMAKKFYTALYIMDEDVIIPQLINFGREVVVIDCPF